MERADAYPSLGSRRTRRDTRSVQMAGGMRVVRWVGVVALLVAGVPAPVAAQSDASGTTERGFVVGRVAPVHRTAEAEDWLSGARGEREAEYDLDESPPIPVDPDAP